MTEKPMSPQLPGAKNAAAILSGSPAQGPSAMPMLSVGNPTAGNGLQLKKGTLWGSPDVGGKGGDDELPLLGVLGHSFEGSPSSPSFDGRQSPRGSPTLVRKATDSNKAPTRLHSQNGHPPRSGGPVHLSSCGQRSELSNVVLTLEAPPITHRRLQPSAVQLKQQALAAGRSQPPGLSKTHSAGSSGESGSGSGQSAMLHLAGGGVGGGEDSRRRDSLRLDDGSDALDAYPRGIDLPASVPAGGEEEVAWLRARLSEGLARNEQLVAQLQRLQQESHGLRSTLLAHQGANRATVDDSRAKIPAGSMQGKGGKIGAANSRHRKRVDGQKGLVMDDEEEAGEGVVVHVHPKAEELTQRILNTLHKKAPFEGHDAADLLQLVAAMAPVDVKAGVDVVKEGESGDLAYWVDTGSLTVVVGGKEVDTIGTDTVFGEVALVYDLARTATIRAKVDSRMWILHRTMFTHILRNKTIADRQAKFSFLQSVQIFGTLSGRMLAMVVDVVEEVVLGANEVVIKEGDEADSMYIIQEGFAAVSQKGASAADGESLLRDLKAGDYFGERALLNEERRSATVTSTSKIKLMRLDKESFRVLLSELHAELLKRVHKDEHKNKSPAPSPGHRREPVVGGSAYISQRSSVKPSKLELLKQLGSGGYGRVSLVRDTSTKRVYALKRVCKAHLLSHNGMMRCEWLLREKRVLEELEHPFIVTLHDTYADTSNLFLLLGCALGGDMYRLIEKLGQVHEKIARFYAGSLTLALAHIHTHEMIYRDLKPENVLLDTQGYVKLCDFGFAKKVTDRTYTRCGTPDYTAPEMLLNQGVNQACDWWALGIMIFEMLMGFPPFSDPRGNDMATYQNITKGELSKYYPASSTATDEARALIQGLCTVKVAYRLGYLKGGASDVMAHAWFAGFDWDGLVNLTVESPWRPALTSSVDTMCFDEPEGTLSLDGPTTIKAIGHELEAKWAALMSEYAKDHGLNETSHLL